MCRLSVTVVSVMALSLLGSALAQKPREFAIGGAGASTCQTFLDSPGPPAALMVSWVQGFLSGANGSRYSAKLGPLLLLPESDEITNSLLTYCKANRTRQIFHAAVWLWKDIEVAQRR